LVNKPTHLKELLCIQAANGFRMFYAGGKFEKMCLIVSQYKQKISHPPFPETKRVLNLWHLHGVDCSECGEHRAVRLLNQWLDILYGTGTALGLDIEGKCRQKRQRYAQANIPYYTEDNAPHFYFGNPFDNVLEQVSSELPPYI